MQVIATTMRVAFENILLKNISKNAAKNGLMARVGRSLDDPKMGTYKRPEWNAHLSFKTAEQLNAKGGFDFRVQPRTRYHAMISTPVEV